VNYNWNWRIFFEMSPDAQGTYLDLLLSGLVWTIVTALCAWVIALAIGSLVGVLLTLPDEGAGTRLARSLANGWVELFRNIPLLVQMFLWYFVLPEAVPAPVGTWLKSLTNAPFYTAVVCLGFYVSARVAVQLAAGIESLPRGQRMAGTAIGLTVPQVYREILLPSAFRIVLPPLGSEFLNCVKNTSVALTIGLLELTARARAMQEFSFQVFEAFTAATLMYLALNLVVVFLTRRLEAAVAVPGLAGAK
jgi:glutamate/aspartate transport system permease protein